MTGNGLKHNGFWKPLTRASHRPLTAPRSGLTTSHSDPLSHPP